MWTWRFTAVATCCWKNNKMDDKVRGQQLSFWVFFPSATVLLKDGLQTWLIGECHSATEVHRKNKYHITALSAYDKQRCVCAQNKLHARCVGAEWRGRQINIHGTIAPCSQLRDAAYFSKLLSTTERDAAEVWSGVVSHVCWRLAVSLQLHTEPSFISTEVTRTT